MEGLFISSGGERMAPWPLHAGRGCLSDRLLYHRPCKLREGIWAEDSAPQGPADRRHSYNFGWQQKRLSAVSRSVCVRRESLCCGVRLQIHRDLCGCAAQREGTVWGHCATGAPAQGQQGEEWEEAGLPEEAGEHSQESQALLGQNCGQKQQEHGFQAQVKILPWPVCALGTQCHPDVPLVDIVEGYWDQWSILDWIHKHC